jgi:phosphatidate cytidylyltransferase
MRRKLEQRIVTGVVLAGVLIGAVFALPLPGLALLFGGVVTISAWEWARLAGYSDRALRGVYVAGMVLVMFGLYQYCQLGGTPLLSRLQPLFGVAALWWAIALLWIKGYPGSAVLWGTPAFLSLMGILVLIPAWLSAVFLLTYPDGKLMLLAMVILVAGADIGAYFTGRRFGRNKLAPAVSPGKSWEGVIGGQLTVALLVVAAQQLLSLPQLSTAAAVAIAVSGAAASVVGDLVESMVKRHRGVKDSGTILPGHGGFLDRIDGITAAAPVVSLGLILAGWLP